MREQVISFSIVTAATVGIGVSALYLALFAAMLVGALLLVPGDLLRGQLGLPAAVADQVRLARLGASIATLGGALGAALESRESVREAACTYQPEAQLDGSGRSTPSWPPAADHRSWTSAHADPRLSGPSGRE